MTAISVKKTLSGLALGAGLFMLLGAATCDGPALVARSGLPNGQCVVTRPINGTAPMALGDVVQIASQTNVNDFIQCHILVLGDNNTGDYLITVSPSDAQGHSFVGDQNFVGALPAFVVNLSR
ncbi:MAG: hypothetical protein E6J91_38625 [Deltaproteobacteria bacterium]|nr:MAG: hypothetical protein E6J91_38625 [Deltaproteobacteria bacterium]